MRKNCIAFVHADEVQKLTRVWDGFRECRTVHTRANPKTAAETKENVTLKASFLTQLI